MSFAKTQPRLLLLLDHLQDFTRLFLSQGLDILLSPYSQPLFQRLEMTIKELKLEDLGFDAQTLGLFFSPGRICGIPMLETKNAAVSLFCLGQNSHLTFHNHPGMLVLSRVMLGELDRVALDAPKTLKQRFLAKVAHRDVLRGDQTTVLTPIKGNIHQLRARTDCVMLDVLVPGYDEDKRRCRFFREIPGASSFLFRGSMHHSFGRKELPSDKKDNKIREKGRKIRKIDDSGDSSSSILPCSRKISRGKRTERVLLEEVEQPREEEENFLVVRFPKQEDFLMFEAGFVDLS